MTSRSEIDYEKVRHAGDHVMPHPFRETDADGNPGEGEWLVNVPVGSRVVDAKGQRFLVLDHGPMQGAVLLRDRYRAMFFAAGDQRLKVVSR